MKQLLWHLKKHLHIIRRHGVRGSIPQQSRELPVGHLGGMSSIEPHILTWVAAQSVATSCAILFPTRELPVVRATPAARAHPNLEPYTKTKASQILEEHQPISAPKMRHMNCPIQ